MTILSQGSQSALLHLHSLNPYIISSLDVARKQGKPVLLCIELAPEFPDVSSTGCQDSIILLRTAAPVHLSAPQAVVKNCG